MWHPSPSAWTPYFFAAGFAGVDAGAFAGGVLVASVGFPGGLPWLLIRSRRWSSACLPCPIVSKNIRSTLSQSPSLRRTFSASVSASHPRPNFVLKAANLPASSSSTFSSFCELGFHSGEFRMSFALWYTGCGFVVRRVKELPSERVMSCVKV